MSFKSYKAALAIYRRSGGTPPDYRHHDIEERKAVNAESALSRKQPRGTNRFKGRNKARAEARKSRY